MIVYIKLLTNEEGCGNLIPTKNHNTDAGFDLKSNEDAIIGPGARLLIKCGFAIEIPIGFEGQVRPRSGLSLKHGITVLNAPGTIDAGYRGEVGVILYNTSTVTFNIHKYDRIAQLVIAEVQPIELIVSDTLSDSERGDKGYGSSGVK